MAIGDVSHDFHQSFSPQLVYVAKIVNLASKGFCGDKYEISEMTGIPTGKSSGKVQPHIKYANYMGLIEYIVEGKKFILSLTKLGEEIVTQDPYFLEEITKWLCNFWITDKQIGAPQWSFLFRVYDNLFENVASLDFIKNKADDFFGRDVDLGVVKNSYQNECFENLKLINFDSTSKHLSFNSLSCKYEAIYVYAYSLVKSWEMYYPDTLEITIKHLIDDIKWNKPFGFDYDEVLEALENLSDIGMIKLNRQLNPVTIIKLSTSDEILGSIYSLLI